jgi:hypothetical protein
MLADPEPGLAEMRRSVFFWREQVFRLGFLFFFRRASIREATCRFCLNPPCWQGTPYLAGTVLGRQP